MDTADTLGSEHDCWDIDTGLASVSKFKKFRRQHGPEYTSLFVNLQKIINILNAGQKLGGFQVGFFRSESEGVYRVGQSSVTSSKESRLYVYPHEESKTMHVLGIGSKESQKVDINEAKKLAKQLKGN